MSHLHKLSITILVLAIPVVGFVPQADAAPGDQRPVIIGAGVDAPDVNMSDIEDAIVAGAPRDEKSGWFVTAVGAVASYGGAPHLGDLFHLDLVEPIVAMAATPSGDGYWLAASDGGVFTFGDAGFFGSAGDIALVSPVVDMATTSSGHGYWLVAADGGVFAFGDATFQGSMGAIRLDQPIAAIARPTADRGYWLVGEDGGVFTFGDATFLGSTGGQPTTSAVVDIVPTGEDGYWLVTEAGVISSFGDAPTVPPAETTGTVVAATRRGSGLWLTQHPTLDVVAVWRSGGFTSASLADVLTAVEAAGAAAVVTHTGTIRVLSVTRDDHTIDAATPGWQIPFTSRAVDPLDAAVFVGGDVAGALERDEVVLGRTTALMRGARPGDIVTFLGVDDSVQRREIGAVVADGRIGAEILFSISDAVDFGFNRASSVWVTGIDDVATFDSALEAIVANHSRVNFVRSWDPVEPDPDSVLSTLRLKRLIGEFEYRYASGDNIDIEPAWIAANIGSETFPILGNIRCNRIVFDDLTAALSEIELEGLAHLIDVADTRRHGGCWSARRIRGTSGDAISRHAWGLALDINPRSNPWGAPPTMDLRIVAIFRRHGFAWGGTWTRPDGMHFEWTGS
ncbi:MAG: M15 family metallopeptidase [Actinomycetia bacterium]|nr:M15 family metallopeptidase [Actinomycetes bacterium]